MKSSKLFRKILASSLALAMVGGAAAIAPAASVFDTGIVASAANSSPVVTVGNFQYVLYDNGTAHVVGFTGTKNQSTTNVGMPSVVYAKDVSTSWTYLQYNSSYKVTQLEASIFNGCKFKTLSLPSNLQALTGGFNGAEIGGFFIDSSNSYFSSYYYSGAYALYNKRQTTLYAYPSNPSLYVSGFGSETKGFASTLTRIEDQAFASSKLTKVTIPATVTYAGDRLFNGSSVNNVIFEGNAPTFRFMPSSSIPDHGTFEGASNLWSVTIKGKDGAYNTDSYGVVYNKDMTKLVLVPQGKTSAFNVASTCTTIGDYAFYHSNANGPVIYDQVQTIESSAFYGVKSNFKVYCLKDTATDTFVKNKGISYAYAYEYTTADAGVTITKYNGPYTSPGVPTTIKGKNVIAIGDEAFKGNTSLTAVYLYSPLSKIGEKAFYGCTSLTNASIPYTVTDIGNSAFYNCKKLKISTLPSKLTKVGNYAFGFCEGITAMTIPNSVTQLNYSAFYGCSNLTSLTIGTGLKSIGAYAFENTGLTTQYIPSTVTTIGNYAFGFTYADSTHTRNSSFSSISGYPGTAAQTYANNNDIPFNSLLQYSISNGEVTIEKYTGSDTSLTIPATIEGKPVTKIKGYAFNGSSVTSVVLPSSLTQIDGYAFYGASKLTSITIPSSVTSIGEYAFEFCTSLKSFTVPATVKIIRNGVFYGCTALASVTLNSGLTSIGAYSFVNTALTSVTIPKTVTTIGDRSFGYNYANSTYSNVDGFKMTGYVDTAAEDYAVENSHITFVPKYETFTNTSTIDKTSIVLGNSVKLSCGATGGKKPYEFAVFYRKGTSGSYTEYQDFSTNASVTFTPPTSGTYSIMVTASDYRNVTASKTFTVTVTAPTLFNTSSVSDNEIGLGDTVTIYGAASGGEAPYKYAVYAMGEDDDDYYSVQESSTNSDVDFTPDKTGTYYIMVTVSDSSGQSASEYFTVEVTAPELFNESTITATDLVLGESTVIFAAASGGVAPYTYEAHILNQDDSVTPIQDFSSNDIIAFTPDAIGTYDIIVNVMDSEGSHVGQFFTVNVTAPAINNESSVSASEVTVGEKVTINGSASGGTEPYAFAYYYKRSANTKWNKIGTEFGTAKTAYFTPTAEAEYDIKVIVRDNSGTTAEKIMKVTASASQGLKNTSWVNADKVQIGDDIRVTGGAEGGAGGFKYAFYFKRSTNTKWNKIGTEFGTATYGITVPKAAANYDMKVIVKDKDGATAEKIFTVTVVESLELTNISYLMADNKLVNSVNVGKTVTAAGRFVGGSKPCTYEFYFKRSANTKWNKLSYGNEKGTYAKFTPTAAAEYDIKVIAIDSKGAKAEKIMKLTAT